MRGQLAFTGRGNPLGFVSGSAGGFELSFLSALPSGATIARTGNATYFNSAGVLSTAGTDVARIDYDPKSLASQGLLYEPSAATNTIQQSTPSTTAVWGSFGLIGLTTGQPGLAGASSATKCTPSASGSSSYRIRQAYDWTAGVATIACDIKSAGWTWIALHFNDLNLKRIWFNIVTGAVGSTQGSGDITGSIIDLGNGWFRLIASRTVDTAAGVVEIWASGGDGSANLNATPNGTDAFLIENIQVENGPLASSRIMTTASAATRNAETLTIAVPQGVDLLRFNHPGGSYTEKVVTPGANYAVSALLDDHIVSVEGRPALPATFAVAGDAAGIPGLKSGVPVYDLNSVTRHKFPYGCDWIEIGLANWYVDLGSSALAEAGEGSAMTVAASITLPNGRVVMLPFGGSQTTTIANGNTGYCDRTFVGLQPGEVAEINIYRRWADDGGVFQTTPSDTANGEKLYQINGSGNLTMTPSAILTGIGTTYRAPPAIIRGNVSGRAFAIIGDSRTVGSQDDGASSHHGELARVVAAAGFPYINLGIGNDQAQKFLLSNSKRLALAEQCSDIITAYGVNDIATGGRSAAQVLADQASIRALFTGKSHWTYTLPPFGVGGTYTTLGGQTVYANDAVRVSYNTTLRAGISGVTVLEVADTVESARNSGKWRVDLGALTPDGTHENGLGNATISASVSVS